MNNADLKKKLRDLRNSIEDFLDSMELDAEETQPKREKKSLDEMKDEFDHPNSKKEH